MTIERYKATGRGRFLSYKDIKVYLNYPTSSLSERAVMETFARGVLSTWGIEHVIEKDEKDLYDHASDVSASLWKDRDEAVKAIYVLGLAKKLFAGAHFESIPISFTVLNGSRSFAQQLTRCRLAGYGHEGTRDTSLIDFDVVVPPIIEEMKGSGRDLGVYECWEDIVEQSRALIRMMEESGVPYQDSSMIAPLALCGDIIAHTNLRVIMDSLLIRLSNQTKWEINHVMKLLVNQLAEVLPTTALWLVPPCELRGECQSHGTLFPPCGKMPLRKDQSAETNHFGERYPFESDANFSRRMGVQKPEGDVMFNRAIASGFDALNLPMVEYMAAERARLVSEAEATLRTNRWIRDIKEFKGPSQEV